MPIHRSVTFVLSPPMIERYKEKKQALELMKRNATASQWSCTELHGRIMVGKFVVSNHAG